MQQTFTKNIVFLDLFSGTGGFAKGLQQAGFVFKKHYYSEIDKYAAANYQYNFRDGQQLGDIKKVSGKQIERPDIISFGSPCQDISLAGKRSGLKGKRSGLFFEAIRLIKECRPRLFVFENVKGIFSSNGGKDFEAVLRAFADIGLYDCQWQLLNTAWFLPQNRERIYLVGTLRSEARQQIFPIGESPRLSQKVGATRTGGGENIASAITSNYSKGVHGRGETYVRVMHWKNSKEKWVQEDKDKIPTLKTQSDLTRQPLIVAGVAYRSRNYKGEQGKIEVRKDSNANQLTTVPKDSMVMLKKGAIRRLTPIECERLQGFPDNWTQYGLFDGEVQEISDTQRYKLLGNAVSVVVVEAVGRKILNKKVALGAIHFQTTTAMDELNGGYKMFKGIALSDAAFKRKYGESVPSENITASPDAFVHQVKNDLRTQHVHNKRSLEQLAATYGITDKNEVKELTELAIVATARTIAQDDTLFIDEQYHRIVDLYNHQVNLSHRTSQSILLQQYSTPAPIGFLMGIFCGLDQLHKTGEYAFEPSAGNGLLTIAAKPERVYVNEVDELRNRNLQTQGFANVTKRDASIDFSDHRHRFAAVLTNPPFGMMDHKSLFDGFPIQPLEHVMALRALDCMKEDGKAAIIIGGHTHWDAKGRIQAGKNRLFFNYLYRHYRVADVIQIDGKRLYSRQGTGFNTRLILISGRKAQPEGVAPVYDREHDVVVHQFDELFVRVMEATKQATQTKHQATVKRYEQYQKLQEQHKGDLLLYRNGNSYEIFGKGAIYLSTQMDIPLSAEFLYEGKGVPLTRLPIEQLEWFGNRLRRMNFGFVVIDDLATPVSKKMETLETEALELLKKLQEGGLGAADKQPSSDDKWVRAITKRYETYLALQAHYWGELLLVPYKNGYEVFGRDCEFLYRFLKIQVSNKFPYDGQTIEVTEIPEKHFHPLMRTLHHEHFHFVILNKEHKIQFLTQDHHRSKPELEIWEMPLADFLKKERQLHKALTTGINYYSLPYKPEYVHLFNKLITNDPLERTVFSPYSAGIIFRRLTKWAYVIPCLKAIHEFEVLLAVKYGIPVADTVIKDYPKLKEKQDRARVFNELRPDKSQLNGSEKKQYYEQ